MDIQAMALSRQVCVILVFLMLPMEVFPMSILRMGKSCVFSEVTGVLLFNGEPAAGAIVKRQVEYQTRDGDQTTADEGGRFSLPALYQRSAAKFLPAEFVAAQSLVVEYQGQEYRIWSNTKRTPEENAELGGQPLQRRCEITAEPRLHRQFGSILRTNCTW